jgi:acetate CoA/acetoacetate CoA-transferase alpha subunit
MGLVGEITETVGGLNRNARALSPKYAVEVEGHTFLLETALKADFAFVYAKQADYIGNLAYALTARNLNPLMAMATEIVLAEAQNIVPVGVIPPDAVMTPAVLVDHLISKEGRNG